ncbi:hypothetical protein CERSUDRAFT_88918, partial [Gelatoporia subvermispora B]
MLSNVTVKSLKRGGSRTSQLLLCSTTVKNIPSVGIPNSGMTSSGGGGIEIGGSPEKLGVANNPKKFKKTPGSDSPSSSGPDEPNSDSSETLVTAIDFAIIVVNEYPELMAAPFGGAAACGSLAYMMSKLRSPPAGQALLLRALCLDHAQVRTSGSRRSQPVAQPSLTVHALVRVGPCLSTPKREFGILWHTVASS